MMKFLILAAVLALSSTANAQGFGFTTGGPKCQECQQAPRLAQAVEFVSTGLQATAGEVRSGIQSAGGSVCESAKSLAYRITHPFNGRFRRGGKCN